MVVNAVYSDGTRKKITDYTVEPDRPLKVEDTAAVIAWNGMTAQIMISVRSESSETPTITGLEITAAPNRTEYKVGEKFDTEGMIISAVYSDGRRQVITDYTYNPDGKLTMKDTEITISWEGMTVKQSIIVSGNAENNNDGSSTTGENGTRAENDTIKTNDSTQPFIWLTVTCVSIVGMIVVTRRKQK